MRESETRTKTFQADGSRTAIIVQVEGGSVSIDLTLGSKTGKTILSPKDLDQLVEIVAAANNFVKALDSGQIALATE